jgi:hypothetical protein
LPHEKQKTRKGKIREQLRHTIRTNIRRQNYYLGSYLLPVCSFVALAIQYLQ